MRRGKNWVCERSGWVSLAGTTTNVHAPSRSGTNIRRMGKDCPYGNGIYSAKTTNDSVSTPITSIPKRNLGSLNGQKMRQLFGCVPLPRGQERCRREIKTVSTFSEELRTSIYRTGNAKGVAGQTVWISPAAAVTTSRVVGRSAVAGAVALAVPMPVGAVGCLMTWDVRPFHPAGPGGIRGGESSAVAAHVC